MTNLGKDEAQCLDLSLCETTYITNYQGTTIFVDDKI